MVIASIHPAQVDGGTHSQATEASLALTIAHTRPHFPHTRTLSTCADATMLLQLLAGVLGPKQTSRI